ncbi:MAG: polymerase, partial [Solirubrobacteraceae bacterium]|nr:polymerase [Solirubrobacteraceae bacterium]
MAATVMTDVLMLLDGNALVHRAFHALPQLTSPKGDLVNATYGFTMMLLRAIQDLHPTHIGAAFDTPKPTFRHVRFDAYKGTRPPTPDGLGRQFATVFEVLEALKIPVFTLDGLEADDLLGTMADRATEAGADVIVITGDTDALQLVGPHVRVLVPRRGMTDTVLYDEAGVFERYGLAPQQLVDLRALRGDVSDNIPGIPGVGEKTATKLLQTYGDVDGILTSFDKMPPKQAAQLQPYVEQMELSRSLAQIVRDAPLDFDLARTAVQPPDRERVLTLFHELGFRSLVDRIPSFQPAAPQAPAPQQGGLFDTAPQPSLGAASTTDVCVLRSLDELEQQVT